LVGAQLCLPYGISESTRTFLYHLVWDGLCYPVSLVWKGVFEVFGIVGDQGMAFILPMLASVLVYLGALGFGVGLLFRKALACRRNAA